MTEKSADWQEEKIHKIITNEFQKAIENTRFSLHAPVAQLDRARAS